MKSIKDLDHLQKSLLFAKLSQLAYNNIDVAKKQAKVLGFTTTEFYDKDGAQAYRFMSKADLVIACRGTQPTEFNDLKADLKALPVLAETVSRVHRGFKAEVDELWPMIKEDIDRKANLKKELWFCGHSLGAAMATIMSSRAKFDGALNDPIELFTYGSPRVGWKGYCNSLGVIHHRWKNNNDIVTTVPPAFLGFKHHGTENYLNAYGLIRTPTGWQLFKDKWRGIWMGLKQGKIDSFSDHSIDEYIKHIESALAE
jgi:triacylglycerol lipase|tara:strand:+ start:3638 stop:4405 length:768 start_codon:yes stop_codon:yes gene_type:complete